MQPSLWIGPGLLSGILLLLFVSTLLTHDVTLAPVEVSVRDISLLLFGPWLLAVELASMLLLAGLIAAYHLAKK